MAEAVREIGTGIAVEEVAKPLDQMTVKELRIECKAKGIKGYSDMNKTEILEAIAKIGVVTEVETVLEAIGQPMTVAVEAPISPWTGFLPELSSVCLAFEDLDEGNFLPADLLEVVSAVRDTVEVQGFDRFTEDELFAMIGTLKNQLPRYQREVFETIALIGTARPMIVDVDFI